MKGWMKLVESALHYIWSKESRNQVYQQQDLWTKLKWRVMLILVSLLWIAGVTSVQNISYPGLRTVNILYNFEEYWLYEALIFCSIIWEVVSKTLQSWRDIHLFTLLILVWKYWTYFYFLSRLLENNYHLRLTPSLNNVYFSETLKEIKHLICTFQEIYNLRVWRK